MRKTGKENGLDMFRLPAAFLVVAIHTAPLAGISADADLFFTRILARIAVPFFLMVSGQYVLGDFLGKGEHDGTGILHFLKKTAILYGIAVLLYLPIGIYAGQYRDLDMTSLVRMVFFDGTFYHLWYFPACVIGVLLLCLLGRTLPFRGILAVAAVLYVIGLGGDSYYGLVSLAPWLKEAYDVFFTVSSYTRNGLFLAPLFLALGAAAGQKKRRLSARSCRIGFALSMAVMTAEGFVLHRLELCRHDSMYAALPFCAYFGYCWLLTCKCRSDRRLRTVAAWIYILHPAVIVLVRGAAKAVGLTGLFVENSLVHYVTVSILSILSAAAAAVIAASVERNIRRICKRNTDPTGRAWIELNRNALRQNVNALCADLPESCALMPAVKADAYGHGAALIARELQRMGIGHFCVASVREGAELRKCGIRGEILVLGYTHPGQFGLLRRYRLTQTVIDLAYAKQLNRYGRRLSVHIAVDTGMHRLGERSGEIERLCTIYRMKNLSVEGIFTHLCADDVDLPQAKEFTRQQADEFYHVVTQLRERGFPCPKIHLSASYGILNYPEFSEDYVRVGIALYGVFGTGEDTDNSRITLSPVLSLKARVASVKKVYAGETVGYGMAYTAQKERTVAVLSIGYADGLPRALSDGVGEVLLHKKRAPIIGRICMDQTIVDVSEIPEVRAGDAAVLIGRSGEEEITVCDIAEKTGTITNEVLSRMGKRLERTLW